MSRRFGRNQRRRAREAIAAKDEELARVGAIAGAHLERVYALDMQLQSAGTRTRRLEAVIEGVRVALGDSVALPAVDQAIDRAIGKRMRIGRPPVVPLTFPDVTTDDLLAYTIADDIADVIQINLEPDHWSRRQHIRLYRNDTQEVVYAIDEKALHTLAKRDIGDFTTRMGREFARILHPLILKAAR